MRRFLREEDGGAIMTMFPYVTIVTFMILVLILNVMMWSYKKYKLQIVADSASRAGTIGVEYIYSVRERYTGSLSDYHVYTELDPDVANGNAQKVIDSYNGQLKGILIETTEFNPTGDYSFPVWNSTKFEYEEKNLDTAFQYKNGNFTVKLTGIIDGIMENFVAARNQLHVEAYSQSAARGSVTSVH